MANPFAKHLGARVVVRWHDPAHDWPTFRVLAVDGDEAWLRGIDDGECKHDGTSFVAHWSEVRSVKRLALSSPEGQS